MKASTTTPAKTPARTGRGGRPKAEDAARIEATILDTARDLFFEHGYGATSIETIARQARMSKRTFYTRFKDKPALFRAVAHRMIDGLRKNGDGGLFSGGPFEDSLLRLAEAMLRATLSKEMLALQRLLLAEAARFPELGAAMEKEGARAAAITGIAGLLKREAKAKNLPLEDADRLAEQFIMLAIAAPQRRAMMLGKSLSDKEIKDWARRAVALFLRGIWSKK